MTYLISFIEGIVTFLSPCLLPMLPIYLAYFAGNGTGHTSKKTLQNAFGFVLGFTLIFVLLGAFAGSIGSLLKQHQTLINIISGLLMLFFGFYFFGLSKLRLFKGFSNSSHFQKPLGFFSALVFGMIFSIGWTPCVGAFLGSALVLASQQGSVAKGILMLLAYSLGLGIPFLLSAVLIDHLHGIFNGLKKHYDILNALSGGFLVLMGIAMITGYFGKLLSIIPF